VITPIAAFRIAVIDTTASFLLSPLLPFASLIDFLPLTPLLFAISPPYLFLSAFLLTLSGQHCHYGLAADYAAIIYIHYDIFAITPAGFRRHTLFS